MGGSSAGDLLRAAVPDWSPAGVYPVWLECVGGACGVAVMSAAALRWVHYRGAFRRKQENSARDAPVSPSTAGPCVPAALVRAYLSAPPLPVGTRVLFVTVGDHLSSVLVVFLLVRSHEVWHLRVRGARQWHLPHGPDLPTEADAVSAHAP